MARGDGSNSVILYVFFSAGSFWSQTVNNGSKESPLVSMHQRPLIVPATLHYSGLQQRVNANHTQETANGKDWDRTITGKLRATVCKYRESGVSREIFNFFIFCSNNLYSELFSKILLKGPEAL